MSKCTLAQRPYGMALIACHLSKNKLSVGRQYSLVNIRLKAKFFSQKCLGLNPNFEIISDDFASAAASTGAFEEVSLSVLIFCSWLF